MDQILNHMVLAMFEHCFFSMMKTANSLTKVILYQRVQLYKAKQECIVRNVNDNDDLSVE